MNEERGGLPCVSEAVAGHIFANPNDFIYRDANMELNIPYNEMKSVKFTTTGDRFKIDIVMASQKQHTFKDFNTAALDVLSEIFIEKGNIVVDVDISDGSPAAPNIEDDDFVHDFALSPSEESVNVEESS